jgi:hypothetical protein
MAQWRATEPSRTPRIAPRPRLPTTSICAFCARCSSTSDRCPDPGCTPGGHLLAHDVRHELVGAALQVRADRLDRLDEDQGPVRPVVGGEICGHDLDLDTDTACLLKRRDERGPGLG